MSLKILEGFCLFPRSAGVSQLKFVVLPDYMAVDNILEFGEKKPTKPPKNHNPPKK